MKICHVIDSVGLYGAERVLLELALAQERMGTEVCIASLGNTKESEKAIESEAELWGIRVHRIREGRLRLGAFRQRLLRVMADDSIDVMHLHGSKPCLIMRFGGVSRRCFPLIYTLHGWGRTRPTLRNLMRRALHGIALYHVDAIVGVSATVLTQGWWSRRHPCQYVVENGIGFSQSSSQTDEIEKNQDATVLYVGRLIPGKGVFDLIAAFGELRRRDTGAQLWIVGDGPCQKELVAFSRSLGVDQAVMFFPFQHETSRFYQQASCLALPSYSEGMPLTLLEAMSHGLPIVASSVGGIPSMLSNGRFGKLVEPGDIDQLTLALEFLLSTENRDQVSKMTQEARRHRCEYYSASRMTKAYDQIIRSLKSRCAS